MVVDLHLRRRGQRFDRMISALRVQAASACLLRGLALSAALALLSLALSAAVAGAAVVCAALLGLRASAAGRRVAGHDNDLLFLGRGRTGSLLALRLFSSGSGISRGSPCLGSSFLLRCLCRCGRRLRRSLGLREFLLHHADRVVLHAAVCRLGIDPLLV